jgi:anti-sigma-K factor RskA
MRNELTEVYLIDNYLLGLLDEAATRKMEADLLLDEALAANVEAQRTAHRVIQLYARQQERSRLQAIHLHLLGEPAFARQLTNLFA